MTCKRLATYNVIQYCCFSCLTTTTAKSIPPYWQLMSFNIVQGRHSEEIRRDVLIRGSYSYGRYVPCKRKISDNIILKERSKTCWRRSAYVKPRRPSWNTPAIHEATISRLSFSNWIYKLYSSIHQYRFLPRELRNRRRKQIFGEIWSTWWPTVTTRSRSARKGVGKARRRVGEEQTRGGMGDREEGAIRNSSHFFYAYPIQLVKLRHTICVLSNRKKIWRPSHTKPQAAHGLRPRLHPGSTEPGLGAPVPLR